ncbi:MAG: anthranilate phosphoribosyltransferase [Oscillospiraceae bacterium]|jgi:anthranilate phosphoribosyltransferase|nr:anthranilate phosphoribosyltransferase [Oscillospiraceae bacterium]
MIKEAITLAAARKDLDYETAEAVMHEIMSGEASEIQMAAYLAALSCKGETIDEITGSAAGMRKHCVRILNDRPALEIVGTGGDKANSFNISSTSAIVVSAAGIPVAKHGNRAATSRSGAADVFEALGVKIDVPPEKSVELLDKINLCFLYAQNYHIAMKYVAPVRRELGIRTIFNILGPLVNPAGATQQLLGVYEERLVEPLARVLTNLGVSRAMVVFGRDGLDEISLSSDTAVCEVADGAYSSYTLAPEDFGLTRCQKSDLVGGTPQENAEITRSILGGASGPKTDAVLLNSAAAIHIARPGVSIAEGLGIARETIASGAAKEQLRLFAQLSNEG